MKKAIVFQGKIISIFPYDNDDSLLPAGVVDVPENSVVGEDVNFVVPVSVSPFQARKALSDAGLLEQVESAVQAARGDIELAWIYGLEVQRNSPMIAGLAATLNLTTEQVDQLFINASKVQG